MLTLLCQHRRCRLSISESDADTEAMAGKMEERQHADVPLPV